MLRTDDEDTLPGNEPGALGRAGLAGVADPTPTSPLVADEQDTVPVPAVAVRETQGRSWAARLGVVDILVAVIAAIVIGADLFVGLGGLRITGNANAKPGTAIVSGTATHTTGTPAATVGPQPTSTLPPIPSGAIHFGGGGDTTANQQCNGTAPLDALTISLSNTQSTVAVDWWVDVQGNTPDGKALWAAANRPYGTLAAGQSDSFTLTPAPNLCADLGGQSPVTYKAVVNYGGVGSFNITDTITPGAGTSTPTPSPTPSGPPGH